MPDDVDTWKKAQDANSAVHEAMADEKAEEFGVTYEEMEIGGIPVVKVTPPELSSKGKLAVYTHGGGHVLFSAKGLIEGAMVVAAKTKLQVIAVDYTLAPHSKWQNTTDEVISVFKVLAEEGYPAENIILYGGSAGGGLAAATTLKMPDLGMQMRGALVLWSP